MNVKKKLNYLTVAIVGRKVSLKNRGNQKTAKGENGVELVEMGAYAT